MSKKLFAATLIALLPIMSFAQLGTYSSLAVVTDYDLDSTSEIYVATGAIGTGSESGAFSMSRADRATIEINVSQLSVTGSIKSRIVCRASGASAWVQVYPALGPGTVTPSYVSLSAVGGYYYSIYIQVFSHCRVGMLIDSADDGNDLTTNMEKVSVTVAYRS